MRDNMAGQLGRSQNTHSFIVSFRFGLAYQFMLCVVFILHIYITDSAVQGLLFFYH